MGSTTRTGVPGSTYGEIRRGKGIGTTPGSASRGQNQRSQVREKFQRRKNHTPLQRQNFHFWQEIGRKTKKEVLRDASASPQVAPPATRIRGPTAGKNCREGRIAYPHGGKTSIFTKKSVEKQERVFCKTQRHQQGGGGLHKQNQATACKRRVVEGVQTTYVRLG